MALHDADTKRTANPPATMDRYAPRGANKYPAFVVASVVLAAILFLFFGDNISHRTTLPPEMTTTPAPNPAPAIK